MTPIPTTTPNDASPAAIRSRRERELPRLALAKARWKRRLTSLDVRGVTSRAISAK
jgi:hypothetical protein